jgi:hypothetical protein
MFRTGIEWVVGTAMVAATLLLLTGDEKRAAVRFVAYGVGVSLATLVASKATLKWSPPSLKAWPRVLLETCVRLMLPIGFLLALAIAKPDLLTKTFFLYFLPFQFLTIAVGASSSIAEVNRRSVPPSGPA